MQILTSSRLPARKVCRIKNCKPDRLNTFAQTLKAVVGYIQRRSALKFMLSMMCLCLCAAASADALHPEWRALLASPGFEGQPVKGVYFFPGESAGNIGAYTVHPLLADDQHWNSVLSSRTRVIDRIASTGANTIVMSYWGDLPNSSPMCLDPSVISPSERCPNPSSEFGLSSLLAAVQNRHLVVLPSIEGGDPAFNQWAFSADFPSPPNSIFGVAPGLVQRIGQLVQLFGHETNLWAKLYDRDGASRYAVAIIHACSDSPWANDMSFAGGFSDVEAEIYSLFEIHVGFVLDLIGNRACAYTAAPNTAGKMLEEQPSVLAVNGYASEVFSGKVKPPAIPCDPHPDCSGRTNFLLCNAEDNNRDNLENLANWKRDAVNDWATTNLPLILDVSSGFDGRIIWAHCPVGAAFWGDNMDYVDDRWRNWLSELKGTTIKGIVFDTWNGYTEGYVAVPSFEYGDTVNNWLTDLFDPDPRVCSHMHYVNGARTSRVYGAICEKWIQLGADRGFGAPASEELRTDHGKVSHFVDGKSIYWSANTGAISLYGIIEKTYREINTDASCLGLPTSDEISSQASAVATFEHGTITWTRGDATGTVKCQ